MEQASLAVVFSLVCCFNSEIFYRFQMRHAQRFFRRNIYIRFNADILPAAPGARIELAKNRNVKNEPLTNRKLLVAVARARSCFADDFRSISLLHNKGKAFTRRSRALARQNIQIGLWHSFSRKFGQRPFFDGYVTVAVITR